MTPRPGILIVDDNPHDIELLTMALLEGGVDADVRFVLDGRAAIDELSRLDPDQRSLWPGVVVLDLNMPITNGHEVLAYAAGEERLRGLPIVVLTTSASPEDRSRSQELGAAAYLVKPRRFTDFDAIVACVRSFLVPGGRYP